ncbi:MAG: tyrosine-type recombinase/integrase [Patescibacteria group bacterium]
MKMKDAIEEFSRWKSRGVKKGTVLGYGLILRQFAVFLRNKDIEGVKLAEVLEWFELQEELGWDLNSFIPRATAVRKLFEYHNRMGLQVIDPWLVPIPRKDYKMPRIADEKTFHQLLDSIPQDTRDPRHSRNFALISMLWDTGARNSEICSIDVDDLDLDRMHLIMKTKKSRGMRPIRELFWTKRTNDALKLWLERRAELLSKFHHYDSDALFVALCNQAAGNRLNMKGVGEMLRRASDRAGIRYMNAHSFRHHMGRQIIHKGGSNSDVSNILGHSSLASSFIYTQMEDVELEERYRIFAEDKPKK